MSYIEFRCHIILLPRDWNNRGLRQIRPPVPTVRVRLGQRVFAKIVLHDRAHPWPKFITDDRSGQDYREDRYRGLKRPDENSYKFRISGLDPKVLWQNHRGKVRGRLSMDGNVTMQRMGTEMALWSPQRDGWLLSNDRTAIASIPLRSRWKNRIR